MPSPKKTAAQRRLEGNPGHRPINQDEPKPDSSKPQCPSWLDKVAKTEWALVCPRLHEIGMLSKVDKTALSGYCAAYSRWVTAEKVLIADGLTYKYEVFDRQGEVINTKIEVRPEVKIAQDSLRQVRMFCAEFGLTPSSRGKMQVPGAGKEPDGPMEKALQPKYGPTKQISKN